jgi:phospholipid/cholesterol/gamma-HCH transport system substrate-binding protein
LRRGAAVTWEQVRVGLLVLMALVLLSVGVFLVGDTGNVFGHRYQLVTLVRSAAGLVPGAAVQLAGQTVGQVDDIRFISPDERPTSGEAVAIWMAINIDVRDQIRRDSRAQVRTQGLLGDKLIDIRPGSPDAEILAAGDTVASAASLDYDALLAEGAEAVGDLVTVARNLADLTEGILEGRGTLGQLVVDDVMYERLVGLTASLDSLIAAASSPDNSLMRLLRDDTLYAAIRSSAAAFDTLARSVVEGEGTLGQMIRSDSLYADLRSTVNRTDSLLATVLAGEGSAGRLFTDEAMYEELLRTLVELNAILEDVRRDPERYVPDISVF